MKTPLLFTLLTFYLFALIHCQQYAPGVNPNHYQQQPPQQQYQPPPPQYQQPPPQQQQRQQYQQPPQQQQQQQYQGQPQQHQGQPQQQQYQAQPPAQPPPPNPHGGHHGHAQKNKRVLNANNIKEERDHIKDHLEVPIDTSGMSEQELQYHYFKMHDADSNNKLDGQELIKSLFHWHDSSNHDPTKSGGHPAPEAKIFTDDELVQMIDPILDQDDRNKDGFIDYPEFVQAQRNAANANAV